MSNAPPNSMLSLFRSDLKRHVDALALLLAKCGGVLNPSADLAAAAGAFHAIRGSGMLLQLPGVIAVAGALEQVLASVQDGVTKVDAQGIGKLNTILDVMLSGSKLDDQQLKVWAGSDELRGCVGTLKELGGAAVTVVMPGQVAVAQEIATKKAATQAVAAQAAEVPEAMLRLFSGDLKQDTERLNKAIVVLGDECNESNACNIVGQIGRRLQSGGKLVKIGALSRLGAAIIGLMERSEDAGGVAKGSIEALRRASDLLQRLVEKDARSIASTVTAMEAQFAELTDEISKFSPQLSDKRAGRPVPASVPKAPSVSPPIAAAPVPVAASSGPVPVAATSGPVVVVAPMVPDMVIPEFKATNPIDLSMWPLFQTESETHTKALNDGLVGLEQGDKDQIQGLMRAAHSLKGASRVMGLDALVEIAHKMEDIMVAAQDGKLELNSATVDLLLAGVDLFEHVGKLPGDGVGGYLHDHHEANVRLAAGLTAALTGRPIPSQGGPPAALPPPVAVVVAAASAVATASGATAAPPLPVPVAPPAPVKAAPAKAAHAGDKEAKETKDRFLRVTAGNLDRLMGLAGESLVEGRWLPPFGESLLQLKKGQLDMMQSLDKLREALASMTIGEEISHYLEELYMRSSTARQGISDRISELDNFIRRYTSLSDRLYHEVIDSRMRPFGDGVSGFPRLVRDIAKTLNKKVRLEIRGKKTPVDRDILEELEAPLNHLIRNACDHGIETPEARIAKGKNPEGLIIVEARHRAGMLAISIQDDGGGIDPERLRAKVLAKGLVSAEMASKLTDQELFEFLYLPGFSTAAAVTEISGRGVGLDVVKGMVQEVSGFVRTDSTFGKGTTFHMQLPLTLSVIRALLVEISGEPYALPLGRVEQVLEVPLDKVLGIEGRQYININGENIGLLPAYQILGNEPSPNLEGIYSIVVIGEKRSKYGVSVEKIIGEKELVVQELDPLIGHVPDISSGALLDNGDPVLVIDVEDLIHSVEAILQGGRLRHLGSEVEKPKNRLRVLIVDDSVTVREVERRLLNDLGYVVDMAVDGMDGWNAIQKNKYDLIITDVDMPRMTGFELTRKIRGDTSLAKLPILIVSYKEREEDRQHGLALGANQYLTKSSFHDDSLAKAVEDLIGKAVV